LKEGRKGGRKEGRKEGMKEGRKGVYPGRKKEGRGRTEGQKDESHVIRKEHGRKEEKSKRWISRKEGTNERTNER
jgi:hypothetical protein